MSANSIISKTKQSFNGLPVWAKWTVYAGGAIALFLLLRPLFKGVSSLFKTAGDILSAPADLIDALNKQMDNAIKDMVYKSIYDYVKTHDYDKSNPEDVYRMKTLDTLTQNNIITANQRQMFISLWKKQKTKEEIAQGKIIEATDKVKEYLSKL